MPIEIEDFAEPLSGGLSDLSSEPVLIKSDAYNQLLHELRRYCNLQASGRSFLIAGHRGSGKTTLVLSVFEEVLRESRTRDVKLRPLMLQLLGPSLLPDPEEKDLAPPGEGAASGEQKLTEFENVLVQLTLALHRAVVRELTQAYRDRMRSKAYPRGGERKRPDAQMVNAFLEAPGQLTLELDEYPGKARLREFWKRAGALPYGLIQRPSSGSPGSADEHRLADQGVRELVALCSVSEVYRRISGTIQAKKKDEAGAQSSETRTRELEVKGKEFWAPLISLLTGGAVATGVAVSNTDRLGIAVLAGVLTALGAAMVSKYSSSRSQQRSSSQEDLFIPNLSVATLDRVLPVLLERIRDAGLAPVFVIDELDKVADLSERIPQMVKRLKKLVAESAFFCFLTDRRYFEEMRCRNIQTPYSIEYTYFTNQLFVAFRHTDLHDYLGRILLKPQPLKPSPTASPEELKAGEDRNQEIDDYAVLPYVVLHAAQMHPIDLRREVSAIRSAENLVALPLGSVRSTPSRRLELLMQVAIELLLEDQTMELELGRDPAFRRLAHDALYFISRRWESDADDLRFDAEGEDCFTKYLVDRMRTERPEAKSAGRTVAAVAKDKAVEAGSPAAPKIMAQAGKAADKVTVTEGRMDDSTQAQAKAETEEPAQPSFTELQIKFLFGFVRQLADLLAKPANVRIKALARQEELARNNPPGTPPRFAAQVFGALNFDDPGPLLVLAPDSSDIFEWRYNRAGRPRVPKAAPGKIEGPLPRKTDTTTPLANREAELVGAFNRALHDLSGNTVHCGNLGATFGVIPDSPAWPSVQSALERLSKLGGEYPEKPEDTSIVGQFAQLLRRGAESIALSIYCGWVFGAWRENKSEERVFAGLRTFSAALRLKELHEERGAKRINQFGTKVVRAINRTAVGAFSLPDADGVTAWREEVESHIEKARGSSLLQQPIGDRFYVKAWEYWRKRLQQIDAVPNLQAVICAVANKGPSEILNFPPEEMTARAWSKAFYAAAFDGAPIPPWLAFAALQRSGFSPQMDMLPDALESLFKNLKPIAISPELSHWRTFTSAKEVRGSAIIVSKAESESEKWQPTKGSPVLVLRAPELVDLLNRWRDREKIVFRWLGLKWLVFDWSVGHSLEESPTERTDELPVASPEEFERAIELIRLLFGPLRPVPAIVPRHWRGELPHPFFPVGAPSSLDQLFMVMSHEVPSGPVDAPPP